MVSLRVDLRHQWKTYLVGLWMVLATLFFLTITTKIDGLIISINKVESTLGSVEGVVSGSDFTLKNMEATLEKLEKEVAVISAKIKRLR